jgi:hypothetical protein
MQLFDEAIQRNIKKWSYPVWFVIKDESTDCTCVDFTTHQAKHTCKKCFGTGKRVILRRLNAAHQSVDASIRGEGLAMGELNIIGVYYTLQNVKVSEGDLILDGDSLDIIQNYYPMRSDHSTPVYYKYDTAPVKTNRAILMKNIKETLKGAGYNV